MSDSRNYQKTRFRKELRFSDHRDADALRWSILDGLREERDHRGDYASDYAAVVALWDTRRRHQGWRRRRWSSHQLDKRARRIDDSIREMFRLVQQEEPATTMRVCLRCWHLFGPDHECGR